MPPGGYVHHLTTKYLYDMQGLLGGSKTGSMVKGDGFKTTAILELDLGLLSSLVDGRIVNGDQ